MSCPKVSLHFYIQSFSLTECIVIVWIRKYRGFLSVCVRLCVYLLAPERQNYWADFN